MNDIACSSSLQNHGQDRFVPTATALDSISTLPPSTPSSCPTSITHLSSSTQNFGCPVNYEGDNIITASHIDAINTYNGSNANQFVQPKLENINDTANSSYDLNDISDHNINIANLSIASQKTSPVPTPSPCYTTCQYSSTPLPTSPPYQLQKSQPEDFLAIGDNIMII